MNHAKIDDRLTVIADALAAQKQDLGWRNMTATHRAHDIATHGPTVADRRHMVPSDAWLSCGNLVGSSALAARSHAAKPHISHLLDEAVAG